MFRIPRPDRAGHSSDALSSVSVIIPARNEAARLPRLLASLKGQWPKQVIVVDDGSTDATAELAREAGARVVPTPPAPEGFAGKTWACQVGASHARGELLVFLDADTWLEPGGLAAMVETRQRLGGVVSVEPYHLTGRPHEQLSSIFNLVRAAGLGAFTVLGRRVSPAGAFGPSLVVTRAEYHALGGHAHPEVRHRVLENVRLGKLLDRRGVRLTCLGGRGTLNTRMYPGGAAELVNGWTKALAQGAGATSPVAMLLVVGWVTGANLATVELVRALAGGASLQQLAAPLALYLLHALQFRWQLGRLGSFGWLTALLHPLHIGLMTLVFLRSMMLTLLGRGVTWKGRTLTAAPRD